MFLKKYQNFLYLILILFSLIPKIYFFQTQDSRQWLYDEPGHIDYVKYILSNSTLPPWYQCWECYQQPLYYISASILFKYIELTGFISEANLVIFLRVFAFFLFYIFLIISVAVFRLVLSPKLALIASSLMLFWPSGAIHSVRIGNDPLLYVFIALSIYFLIYWWVKNTQKSLILSIIFMLLGILTKTNAIILLPVIIACYIIRVVKLKKIVIFLMILFLIVGLTMIINQRNNLLSKQDNWLVANWKGIPKSLYVSNGLENFLSFDIKSYFEYPNITPGSDEGGRQYFWLYLIKSSLFGELTGESISQQNLAKVISLLALVLIVYVAVGLINLDRPHLKLYLPLILALFSFISAMVIFRIYFPCSCTNDFRFIYPSLIPIFVFITNAFNLFSRNRLLWVSSIILISYFIILSFLFHLPTPSV